MSEQSNKRDGEEQTQLAAGEQPPQQAKTFYLHKLKPKVKLNITIPTSTMNNQEMQSEALLRGESIMLDMNVQHKDEVKEDQIAISRTDVEISQPHAGGNQEKQTSSVKGQVENSHSLQHSEKQKTTTSQSSFAISANAPLIQSKPYLRNDVSSKNNLKRGSIDSTLFRQRDEQSGTENQIIDINGVKIPISKLRRVEVLGHGTSGLVEKAVHEPTGIVVGIKSIPLLMNSRFRKSLDQELCTLISCNSPNIVKCYGAFIQKCLINITLEYMDLGSIHDLVQRVGPLPEKIVAIIAIQVVLNGLDYIHNQVKVIHRDIKPSNLLVSSKGEVKIADFGVSANMESAVEAKNWVGTVTYMSPERFRGQPYTANTDIWSLGLTICECALGKYPYFDTSQYGKNENLSFWELLEYFNIKPAPRLPEHFSDEMKDFLSKCLKKSPADRLSSSQLLEHPMVKKFSYLNSTDFASWIDSEIPVEKQLNSTTTVAPQPVAAAAVAVPTATPATIAITATKAVPSINILNSSLRIQQGESLASPSPIKSIDKKLREQQHSFPKQVVLSEEEPKLSFDDRFTGQDTSKSEKSTPIYAKQVGSIESSTTPLSAELSRPNPIKCVVLPSKNRKSSTYLMNSFMETSLCNVFSQDNLDGSFSPDKQISQNQHQPLSKGIVPVKPTSNPSNTRLQMQPSHQQQKRGSAPQNSLQQQVNQSMQSTQPFFIDSLNHKKTFSTQSSQSPKKSSVLVLKNSVSFAGPEIHRQLTSSVESITVPQPPVPPQPPHQLKAQSILQANQIAVYMDASLLKGKDSKRSSVDSAMATNNEKSNGFDQIDTLQISQPLCQSRDLNDTIQSIQQGNSISRQGSMAFSIKGSNLLNTNTSVSRGHTQEYTISMQVLPPSSSPNKNVATSGAAEETFSETECDDDMWGASELHRNHTNINNNNNHNNHVNKTGINQSNDQQQMLQQQKQQQLHLQQHQQQNQQEALMHSIQNDLQREICERIEEEKNRTKSLVESSNLGQSIVDNLLLSVQIRVKASILQQLPALIRSQFDLELQASLDNLNRILLSPFSQQPMPPPPPPQQQQQHSEILHKQTAKELSLFQHTQSSVQQNQLYLQYTHSSAPQSYSSTTKGAAAHSQSDYFAMNTSLQNMNVGQTAQPMRSVVGIRAPPAFPFVAGSITNNSFTETSSNAGASSKVHGIISQNKQQQVQPPAVVASSSVMHQSTQKLQNLSSFGKNSSMIADDMSKHPDYELSKSIQKQLSKSHNPISSESHKRLSQQLDGGSECESQDSSFSGNDSSRIYRQHDQQQQQQQTRNGRCGDSGGGSSWDDQVSRNTSEVQSNYVFPQKLTAEEISDRQNQLNQQQGEENLNNFFANPPTKILHLDSKQHQQMSAVSSEDITIKKKSSVIYADSPKVFMNPSDDSTKKKS